jgi:hypothetical protein
MGPHPRTPNGTAPSHAVWDHTIGEVVVCTARLTLGTRLHCIRCSVQTDDRCTRSAWLQVRTIRDATLFTTPRGLGLTRDGHLLVAERQRVALLGARGTRLLAQATIPDAVSMLGVGVDARSGAIYVADPAAGKVFVLRAESAPCERSGAVR